jgi:hypothetical protein
MNVAVCRNLSLAHSVCDTAPALLVVRACEVLSCIGLGSAAVATAKTLHEPTETVHGELGWLTSFLARALLAHVRRVHPASLLCAFALPAARPCSLPTSLRCWRGASTSQTASALRAARARSATCGTSPAAVSIL